MKVLDKKNHFINCLRQQDKENQTKKIIEFAGCWENMSDQDFDDFTIEIERPGRSLFKEAEY